MNFRFDYTDFDTTQDFFTNPGFFLPTQDFSHQPRIFLTNPGFFHQSRIFLTNPGFFHQPRIFLSNPGCFHEPRIFLINPGFFHQLKIFLTKTVFFWVFPPFLSGLIFTIFYRTTVRARKKLLTSNQKVRKNRQMTKAMKVRLTYTEITSVHFFLGLTSQLLCHFLAILYLNNPGNQKLF